MFSCANKISFKQARTVQYDMTEIPIQPFFLQRNTPEGYLALHS